MVGIDKIFEAEYYIEVLEKCEYSCLGECGRPGRYFLVKGPPEDCNFHLHLVQIESKYWTNNLLFKNYLMSNPEQALEYANLKQQLAKKFRYERDLYRIVKSEFVEKLLEKIL